MKATLAVLVLLAAAPCPPPQDIDPADFTRPRKVSPVGTIGQRQCYLDEYKLYQTEIDVCLLIDPNPCKCAERAWVAYCKALEECDTQDD